MPLYDFDCKTCDKVVEKICKYSEIEQQVCPNCGAKLQFRKSAPASFKFNGVKGSNTM